MLAGFALVVSCIGAVMPADEISNELKEIKERLTAIESVLRGDGMGIGLIAQVQILWRSWAVGLSLLSAAGGFFLRGVFQ
jgi:hypothetical protein